MQENNKNTSDAVENFLYNIQLNRKVSFFQYILSFKIMIIMLVSALIIFIFGEQVVLYVLLGAYGLIYWLYRQDKLNFIFKISKEADKTIFSFLSKNTKRVYKEHKHILMLNALFSELFFAEKEPKKKKEKGLWGIKIKTKERLNKKDGENVKFGVIITLKEVNGVNRIQEFIQQCQFRGWLVNKIDIENRIDIYNIAREEIELE